MIILCSLWLHLQHPCGCSIAAKHLTLSIAPLLWNHYLISQGLFSWLSQVLLSFWQRLLIIVLIITTFRRLSLLFSAAAKSNSTATVSSRPFISHGKLTHEDFCRLALASSYQRVVTGSLPLLLLHLIHLSSRDSWFSTQGNTPVIAAPLGLASHSPLQLSYLLVHPHPTISSPY